MFDLKNKVALVTGGASGIGLSYAKEVLRRGAKAVVLLDINEENGKKAVEGIRKEFKRNDCTLFIKTDVTNSKEFEDAFDKTVKTYGQLDVLFNNAGIMNEVQWRKCVDVNFVAVINGTMLATERYFPKYRSGSESLIVNIAALAGVYPLEEAPVYMSTKSGIIGFTRAMGGATRYSITKTKIIAICPGFVDTPILNVTRSQLQEPFYSTVKSLVEKNPSESADDLAKHTIDIIFDAKTGSVWAATAQGCSEVEFPSKEEPSYEK